MAHMSTSLETKFHLQGPRPSDQTHISRTSAMPHPGRWAALMATFVPGMVGDPGYWDIAPLK